VRPGSQAHIVVQVSSHIAYWATFVERHLLRYEVRSSDLSQNVAMANALQLEAARATPVLFRSNYDAIAKFKLAQPVNCRIIAFVLLIH